MPFPDTEIDNAALYMFNQLSPTYNPKDAASIVALVRLRIYQESFIPSEFDKVDSAMKAEDELIRTLIHEGWQ